MESLIPRHHEPRRWIPKYDAIIDLMLAQPHMKRGEIALRLDMTGPWLSNLVNSDTFKERLRERRDELSGELCTDISSKMTYALDLSLDRSIERLESDENGNSKATEGFIAGTRDSLLSRLGYISGSRVEKEITVKNPAEVAWLARRRRLEEPIEAEFKEVE